MTEKAEIIGKSVHGACCYHRGHAAPRACALAFGLEHPVNSNAMFRRHCYPHFTSRCRCNGSDRVTCTFGPTSMCSTDTSPAARRFKGRHNFGVWRVWRWVDRLENRLQDRGGYGHPRHGHILISSWARRGRRPARHRVSADVWSPYVLKNFSPCFSSRCPPPPSAPT